MGRLPGRGRLTIRWSKSEQDYVVAWGPGPGRLKGPAGGLLGLVIEHGSLFKPDEPVEEFRRRLQRMGLNPDTFKAQVDVLLKEPEDG